MEEPRRIVEDCVCIQAMTTLQQYEIPIIQKVVQVLSVGKINLPMSVFVWFFFFCLGLGGFFFILGFFGVFLLVICFPG